MVLVSRPRVFVFAMVLFASLIPTSENVARTLTSFGPPMYIVWLDGRMVKVLN